MFVMHGGCFKIYWFMYSMNICMFCLELKQCHASHDRCGQATADRCVHACLTMTDCLCCPRAMMACHAWLWPTVFVGPRKWWHAAPDAVRPCVLSMGYDGMPRPTTADRLCLSKGDDGMPRPTPSDRVCYPRAMMAWHARRWPIVCAVQGRDCMPHRTSFDRVCRQRAMMACHAWRRPTVCPSPNAMMAWHAQRR